MIMSEFRKTVVVIDIIPLLHFKEFFVYSVCCRVKNSIDFLLYGNKQVIVNLYQQSNTSQ